MTLSLLFIPKLMAVKDRIIADLRDGISIKSVASTIQDPEIVKFASDLVDAMLPGSVAGPLKLVAAIGMCFDTNGVRWIQRSLNVVLAADLPEPLAIDGHTGPKTIAAVRIAQQKLGLPVDGWAGDVTMAAVKAAMNALEEHAPTAPASAPSVLPTAPTPAVNPPTAASVPL